MHPLVYDAVVACPGMDEYGRNGPLGLPPPYAANSPIPFDGDGHGSRTIRHSVWQDVTRSEIEVNGELTAEDRLNQVKDLGLTKRGEPRDKNDATRTTGGRRLSLG
jgi:hypothetical protein